MSLPHVYASQIEYMCKHLKYRDDVIVSLHPHNDRGNAVADSEQHARRRGPHRRNAVRKRRTYRQCRHYHPCAEHVHSASIQLDFSHLPKLTEVYERVTRMHVYDRQPYSGALVFAAFSGSHPGRHREGHDLPRNGRIRTVDRTVSSDRPGDLGLEYDKDVIRINSQSGKGRYRLRARTEIRLRSSEGHARRPRLYGQERFRPRTQGTVSLTDEVRDIFTGTYVNIEAPLQIRNTISNRFPADVSAQMSPSN